MNLAGAYGVFMLASLLSAGGVYAQQQNGQDLSPAKSNCGPDFKTCANYATGQVTNQVPNAGAGNATSAQGPGGDLSPAKSNCDSKTGCADYATGDQTTVNPAQEK
jgi:hypothetical protein